VPLTEHQQALVCLLSQNRTPDSYLAGGAALHIEPNSLRYSNDLDYFHDSIQRVAQAFEEDRALVLQHGFGLSVEIQQPGYVRATIERGGAQTSVEWAHDSAWRFLPTVEVVPTGYQLHPIDLATNKVLALVGRNEPRDYLDVIDIHERTLPLGALAWAAVGKDPGFTPFLLLDLLKRKGKFRPEDFARLHLRVPVDVVLLKKKWHQALVDAERFIKSRPPDEIGCLYYSPDQKTFVEPGPGRDAVPHYGRPGGVLPLVDEGA
jgi:hypothetical protein